MKQLKILGLAVVAAAALMAFVGTGTASATFTSLCKAPTTNEAGLPICEGEHVYPANTRIHAELQAGSRLNLATGLGVVECAQSTLEAFTEQKTEIPLGANVTAFNFGGCFNGPEEVEVKTINPGTLDIEIIDLPNWTHNGTLTFTRTEVTVFFKKLGLDCIFAPGDSGTLTGGPMATIDFSGNWPRVGGGMLCPPNANVTGAYTVTSPEPLWVGM